MVANAPICPRMKGAPSLIRPFVVLASAVSTAAAIADGVSESQPIAFWPRSVAGCDIGIFFLLVLEQILH